MSLFTEASLVMIPSGVKDGKLYSIKPDDGVGDFTFTRGSNLAATRVDENGLIEKGRENLLLRSNAFTTSPWTTVSATRTSGQTGYDGSSDAWLLEKTASAGYIQQINAQSNVINQSVYVKANASGWCQLLNGVGFKYYDLINGVVGSGSAIDSTIESVGNGWHRITITSLGCSYFRIYPAEADNDKSAASGSIYIQDAQLELGLVATDYIETGATSEQAGILENLPRLDYTDSSCPSLLLEPTRTNLVTNSEYMNDWSKVRATLSFNEEISPEGVQNASLLVDSVDNNSHIIQKNYTTSTGTEAVNFSLFAKKQNNRYIIMQLVDDAANVSGNINQFVANYDLESGVVTDTLAVGSPTNASADIENYGNGWYRLIIGMTKKSGVTRTDAQIRLTKTGTAIQNPVYAGTGNDGNYIYGAQLEVGSYPTSYIPTYGTSVTRSVDLCVGAGDATTFNDAEGVLFVEFGALTDDNNGSKSISISSGAYSNNIIIQYTTNTNQIAFKTSPSYTTPIFQSYNVSDITENSKIAFKYKLNDCSFWHNGSKLGSVTSFTPFSSGTLTQLNFNRGDGSEIYEGNVKSIIYFPTALTDSELAALTTI